MGASVSHAAAPPPPPPVAPPPAHPLGLAAALPPTSEEKKDDAAETVDYMNLPCPVPFEEIQREALMSLKPELFEGLRFDFTKGLNQKFSLSHSVFMGSMEVPSQPMKTIKVPTANYEFGANFLDPKLMLVGRILTDGRLNARVKCDLTDNLALKINAQLTNEPHYSQGMFNFDYKFDAMMVDVVESCDVLHKVFRRLGCHYKPSFKTQGKDYRTQFQIGNNAFYGANYIQVLSLPKRGNIVELRLAKKALTHFIPSVTPFLSMGSEIFWLGHQRKSGLGFAARYNTAKWIGTAQVSTTGMVALSYVQKVSEKVSFASDFMYNHMTRDVTASCGYDYILRQCRLRGKVDSNGCVAAFLEERLSMGVNFILSAEIDHLKKDYKFGFGLTVGE